MFQTIIKLIIFCFLLLIPLSAFADLDIVATVPDLAAIAKQIGREMVEVTALSLPTQDPHFVDARPNLMLDLNQADLLLLTGLDLEIGWLPVLLTGARNPDIQRGTRGYLDCSQFVDILEVPVEQIDRSMGDIHPGGNPHYLFDPNQAILVAEGITQRMKELDYTNAQNYENNLQSFVQQLQTKIQQWESRLSDYKEVPIICYHKSFVYLSKWLEFNEVAYIEPKPGIPPNPSHVATVMGVAQTRQVPIILQESFYPSNVATLIAQNTSSVLVTLPGGTNFREDQTYIEHIEQIITLIEVALKG